jgi:hypothetical protein
MGAYHDDRFEAYIAGLKRHRLTRRGRGPAQMKISGIHRV